jgi:MAF protein
MREHGYEVEVITPPLEEPVFLHSGLPPAEQAEALSYFKAESAATVVTDGVILAGDTIVSLKDQVYGKPADREDARMILSALAGTTHCVITGVALLDPLNGERLIRHDTTAVTMRPISSDELEAYLDTDAWSGKAGAYGIQDRGDAFVERIDGSFTNVVGFPMELVSQMLGEWGIHANSQP